MPKKEQVPAADEPTDDLVELDGEYEYADMKYGPGHVKIENRQARRAILRAIENAREEREAKSKIEVAS